MCLDGSGHRVENIKTQIPAIINQVIMNSFAESVWNIEKNLSEQLDSHSYSSSQKVKYKLNPLSYAANPHINFLQKYMNGPKITLFVGLNPGPWGMCQTGVPFGDVNQCCSFLDISGGEMQLILHITQQFDLVRKCNSTIEWPS